MSKIEPEKKPFAELTQQVPEVRWDSMPPPPPGYPVMMVQPGYMTKDGVKSKSNAGLIIFGVLMLLWMFPFGLVGLVLSLSSRGAYKSGNGTKGKKHAKASLCFSVAGLAIGAAMWTAFTLLTVSACFYGFDAVFYPWWYQHGGNYYYDGYHDGRIWYDDNHWDDDRWDDGWSDPTAVPEPMPDYGWGDYFPADEPWGTMGGDFADFMEDCDDGMFSPDSPPPHPPPPSPPMMW